MPTNGDNGLFRSEAPAAAGSGTPDVVVAIDPGRSKCGVAAVCRGGAVLFRAVVDVADLPDQVRQLTAAHRPCALLVGAGTGSERLLKGLRAAGLEIPLLPVDEAHTSEEARSRFVAENRPRGLQLLLPRCLRTPWRPYDDYVAIILAERFWRQAAARPSSQDRR